MAVLFSDTFTRADGSFSGDSNYNNAGDADWDVASNQASSSADSTFMYVGASSTNAYVQAKWVSNVTTAELMAALSLSVSDLSNRYDVIIDGTAGTQRLRKRVAGSGTDLATGFGAPSANQVVRLEKNGNTVRVLYDGVQKASVSDTDLSGPYFGGFNGGPGGGANPCVIDNFEFGDFTTPAGKGGFPRGIARGVGRGLGMRILA